MDGNDFTPAGKAKKAAAKVIETVEAAPTAAPVLAAVESIDEGAKRIEEIRARRSQRGTMSDGPSLKLDVPEDLKDPRFTYRWVNDRSTRVHDLKARDWDFAPDNATNSDARDVNIGTRPERIVNERTTPSVEKAFLMRKPKEFYAEDNKRSLNRLRELEEGIQRGETRDPEGLSGPHAYVPAGGISIKHK